MSDPHVHHYVPQFYQRGFNADRGKRIWVYEKGCTPRHRSVRSTGMQIDLYAFQHTSGSMDFGSIEKELSLLDDRAAKIIQRLERRERCNDHERTQLARFASVLWRRKSKHKNKVNRMAIDLLPQVLEPLKSLDALPIEVQAEIDRIRRDYSQNPPAFLFAENVLRDSQFEERMVRMDWVFFEAGEGSEFLTSDDPVMFSQGSGLDSPDAVIAFPLSRKLLLQCMWSSSYHTAFYPLTSDKVDYFNECTIKNAYKQVYASERVEQIQQTIDDSLGLWE